MAKKKKGDAVEAEPTYTAEEIIAARKNFGASRTLIKAALIYANATDREISVSEVEAALKKFKK